MLDKFEVVLPGPEEMAHRPPPGFHTFYINQLEMGLRFPIRRFISYLCQHIKVSPSQLAPNSYSFLLALAILLSYYNIPLIPYVLMQLTTPVTAKAIPEVPSFEVGPRTETGPRRAPALNIFEDSLVVSPSGSVAMGLLCNMIPNRDVAWVRNATNAEVVGLFVTQFAAISCLSVCFMILLLSRSFMHSGRARVTAKRFEKRVDRNFEYVHDLLID
ncbi:hypothetical protein F511_34207 [Dorcoceras hygrometricum]|uniref:Uncharacterized protein n=1 Tax=Dorcoceras hygrometricum TaxID=472368 RepID=A0A2Z7ATT0_9LAMI|nr:hypothetical protein F511_34207 [Dorcoceras hygrometricum]